VALPRSMYAWLDRRECRIVEVSDYRGSLYCKMLHFEQNSEIIHHKNYPLHHTTVEWDYGAPFV
jgi:hypothetical protein